jgi:hypothetical protein
MRFESMMLLRLPLAVGSLQALLRESVFKEQLSKKLYIFATKFVVGIYKQKYSGS